MNRNHRFDDLCISQEIQAARASVAEAELALKTGRSFAGEIISESDAEWLRGHLEAQRERLETALWRARTGTY